MGLDMYLYAERYVSGWNHNPEPQFSEIANILNVGNRIAQGSPSMEVRFTVGYWRKANAIHSWFVTNVQDGEDECNPHHVSREQLIELRDTAQAAMAAYEAGDKDKARDLLTPTDGFFFGNTEVNEWYYESLKETVKQVENALALDDAFDFTYRSSW